MGEPVWLRDDVVLAIHRRQLAEHCGAEGLRDAALLASALARPRNQLAYSDPKPYLADLAAAYAFGIARNHPFVDGNKRTAFVAYRTFLKCNGRDIEAPATEKYLQFIGLAEGSVTEDDLADWIRAHLIRG
ncbi:MAG: type II toxin-antitoxin system death-on-curing family toxin [Phycisphaerae bacterium]